MRDIRELADQPAAYAEELSRHSGGLLSYRYMVAELVSGLVKAFR